MASSYEILGIPHTAKKEDIKRAYRRLSMIYHPDKPTGNKEKFMRIKDAYEQLMVIKPERVHQQYQHRGEPYVNFNHVYLDKKGDCIIDISYKNIGWIEGVGILRSFKYHWSTIWYNGGTLTIEKKDLIRCGYKFTLKFVPVIGHSMTKDFVFTDPRTKWEKFKDKYLSWSV